MCQQRFRPAQVQVRSVRFSKPLTPCNPDPWRQQQTVNPLSGPGNLMPVWSMHAPGFKIFVMNSGGHTRALRAPSEHRRFTGHVRSIKSNQALTPEFNAGRSNRSRAEDLDALTNTVAANAGFHLKDPSRPISRGGFETSHQIAQWVGQQMRPGLNGSGGPATGVAHNEVLTRLWPWDITQV